MAKRTYHRGLRKKNRKVSEMDRTFYKLGVQDGEDRIRASLVAMQNANRCLAEEIARLDKEDPIVGVVVPFGIAERIAQSLPSSRRDYYNAKTLRRMIKRAKIKAGIIPK